MRDIGPILGIPELGFNVRCLMSHSNLQEFHICLWSRTWENGLLSSAEPTHKMTLHHSQKADRVLGTDNGVERAAWTVSAVSMHKTTQHKM